LLTGLATKQHHRPIWFTTAAREKRLHRYAIFFVPIAIAACRIGIPGVAAAQKKAMKDQLVGTWRLLWDDGIKADGSEVPRFGPNPVGVLIFAADGHYSLQIMRVDGRPAALSSGPNSTNPGAPDVPMHFGTYTIDSENILYFHIEARSMPNLVGSRKGRPITAVTDEFLTWDDPPTNPGA
jgi:hypothetical protein